MIDEWHSGFVLHTRKYRESSLLLTLWLEDYGKLNTIARGVLAKGGKKSYKKRNLFQPFSELRFRLNYRVGRLNVISGCEQVHVYPAYDYICELGRLYVNEVLYWLMPEDIADAALFDHYRLFLKRLDCTNLAACLRDFELKLLTSLGFGINVDEDIMGKAISEDQYYAIYPGELFFPVVESKGIKGEFILQMSKDPHSWSDEMLKAVKKITRIHIDALLEGRVLLTRQLIKQAMVKPQK
ncbi:MAG: DNA repair protein RecO [Francisellaceae bacterium]